MRAIKNILTILLAVAIATTGIPVQAESGCPMATHMQMSKDCKGCTVTGKHEPKKSGCCDDGVCAAKCSMLGGIVANMLPAKIALPEFAAVAEKFYTTDSTLPFRLLQTQDRPPKHLS